MELLTRFDDSTVTIYNHHSDANHHNNIRALPSVTMRPERSLWVLVCKANIVSI